MTTTDTWHRQPAQIERRALAVGDKVLALNGEVAVVTALHTHYNLRKSQETRPHDTPIVEIRFIVTGTQRYHRADKLQKVTR